MRRDEARRLAGFTLIELMVVLILFGVVALISFPALQNAIARSRLEGTVRQVGILMQTSRYEAIKNSTPVSWNSCSPALAESRFHSGSESIAIRV